jgi:TolB-like protein
LNKFITELKRRNVAKVAVLYVITGWLVLQAADVLFALLGLPEWTLKLVLGILLLGFPIALIISWIYEMTPEGLKLEKEVDRSESITAGTGRKINAAILVGLALAIGLMLYQQFGSQPIDVDPTPAQVQAETPPMAPGSTDETGQPLDATPSVAVLPFVNMSSDKEQEYFADGLSDTLMHVLAQVRGLKVAARTSSFAFKGKNINVAEIAAELGVATVLEGSVQKAGDKVRVIAQLIDASDGSHLWSANFDRDLADIFAIQDEIAREVVVALKVALMSEDESRLAERYQPSLEAYEQVILARQKVELRTAASLKAAETHFKRAMELDPNYSLAYAGLADTYALLGTYSDLVFEESIGLRQPLVSKALELDPLSGEAHTSRASLIGNQGDFEGAAKAYERAIELSPSYARAYHWYSGLLSGALGRPDESLEMARIASELDPLSPIIRANYSRALWEFGRVEEAMFMVREGIRLNPDFPNFYRRMSGMLNALGRVGEARRWHQEVLHLNPEGLGDWSADCLFLLQLADDLMAESCVQDLLSKYPGNMAVVNLQFNLNVTQGNHQKQLDLMGPLAERFAAHPIGSRQVQFALGVTFAQMGDLAKAKVHFEMAYPEFFLTGDPGVDDTNWEDALWIAWLLKETGIAERAEMLLSAAEKTIATRHRTRGLGYGVSDVVILCIRGDNEAALTQLRKAIDEGWRTDWRIALYQDVRLAGIADDPRYIAMVQEVEADISAQREWYEQNKDQPLL